MQKVWRPRQRNSWSPRFWDTCAPKHLNFKTSHNKKRWPNWAVNSKIKEDKKSRLPYWVTATTNWKKRCRSSLKLWWKSRRRYRVTRYSWRIIWNKWMLLTKIICKKEMNWRGARRSSEKCSPWSLIMKNSWTNREKAKRIWWKNYSLRRRTISKSWNSWNRWKSMLKWKIWRQQN